MKRPLCAFALILAAAVLIYLELFYPKIMADHACPYTDGSYVTITGMVAGKELSKGYEGEEQLIFYVVPSENKENRSLFSGTKSSGSKMIQCYMGEGGGSAPKIGTFLRLQGRVKEFFPPTNPGEFDSRLYYSTLKISYRLTDTKILAFGGSIDVYRESLFRLKVFLGALLDASLSSEDAGIMKAMLLGDKSSMDKEVRERFKAAGIVHIMAISGTHIAILGMGLYRLLRKILYIIYGTLPRLIRKPVFGISGRIFIRSADIFIVAISILVMYSYGVMCGMGSSAFRAILMFSLRILASIFGRTYDILTALALSEILLLIEQPLYLYNSGFLMSFAAVIGLVLIRPYLKLESRSKDPKMHFADEKEKNSIAHMIAEGIRSSLAIAIATLPVYAMFYYTYPIHSLFINLLILPAMGVLLILTIVCLLLKLTETGILLGGSILFAKAGELTRIAAKLPAFGIHAILGEYKAIASVKWFNACFTWYMGHSDKWRVVVYVLFVSLFVAMNGMYEKRKAEGEKPLEKFVNIRGLSFHAAFDLFRYGMIAAAVVILVFRPSPDLSIHMIDVDQGDSFVISSAGKNLLIDGGSTSKKNVGKYRIIPFLKYQGIGSLDGIVVTHEDEDHISGILELMDDMEKGGIRIKRMILPQIAELSKGDNYRLLEKRAVDLSIPILYIDSGESFELGRASFYCLNPEEGMTTEGANEYSTTLFMRYDSFTALFTGDVEGEGLEYVKEQLRVLNIQKGITLLKVAHHGSRYTTDDEFLDLIYPEIALISCGHNNSYGHPHEELLERLEDHGASVFRTDRSGEISFYIENDDYRILSYKH